jgi:hypothetical protein
MSSADQRLRVVRSKPARPFRLAELMLHDIGQAWWNIRKRYTNPFKHYDHWSSARGFIWSALTRPYWHWKTRNDFR